VLKEFTPHIPSRKHVMKYKTPIAMLSVVFCANALADPVYLPPGQNLTYGSSSNNQFIMSSITNPAAAAAQLGKEDSQYRFGILSSIGGGYEFGNVNDLYNKIDASKATLTSPITISTLATLYQSDCGPTPPPCSPANLATFANHIASTINTSAAITTLNTVVLPALQKDGKATVFVDGHVPFMPLVVSKKSWGGSLVLDANVSAVASMSFIADPLFISSATATSIAQTFDNAASTSNTSTYALPTIANDSTLRVKAAMVREVGLGYSRPMLSSETGDLTAGIRAKYYQVKLERKAQKLITSSGAKSTFKASQTSYTSSSGLGLDVGTLWTAKRYRVGAWVNNLNKPSFKYNDLTAAELTTAGYTSGTPIYNQLASRESYEMKPQLELEGAFFSESQNWVVNAGVDANAVPDPVGRDFQWATLSAAYATNSWWIPGIRIGYRTGLAGSKLRYATAGLTIIKALSLDVAYGLDSIKDNNGKVIPRSAMINLGIQMTF
jgi:hypothetical protein